jgi:hypothetical protein
MRYTPIAIAISLVTTLPAQVTSKVTTASENRAWATFFGNSTSGNTIPPGTDISPSRTISGSGSIWCSHSSSHAAATTSLTIAGGGKENFSFYAKTQADQASWNCAPALIVRTHGDVYFDLTSNSGALDGTLVVTVTYKGSIGNVQVCNASVDIGADGSVEFNPLIPCVNSITGAITFSSPLTLSPTPTRIRVTSQLLGQVGIGSDGDLRVDASFLPPGGSITKRANACPSGVDLKVSHVEERAMNSPRPQIINLRPVSLPTSATVCVYAFGTQEWQIPLGPTNCLLRNNATVLIFVPPSAPEAVLNFPARMTPITFYAQFAFATKAAGGYDLLHTSDSFLVVLK